MYFLLSGEGPSDIGVCNTSTAACDTDGFKPGPMAWLIDRLAESYLGYDFSHLNTSRVSYVSEAWVSQNRQKRPKKSVALRGKKKPAETKYYYENARTLVIAAKHKADEVEDTVVAILFRDADGTASAGRGNWRDKRESMIKGFCDEDFEYGVPMVPKPKSEAWVLCAVKNPAYQACEKLENESGNDNSPNSLKRQLHDALNGKNSPEELNDMIQSGAIDVQQIDMTSYNHFKDDLRAVIMDVTGMNTDQ